MKNWLFRFLFGGKYQALLEAQARATTLEYDLQRARAQLADLQPRPARFRLDGGLAEEEIAGRLAGSAETPLIQAVVAVLDRKIVEMTDRATNPPSETNTPDLRTYEAGGANAIAELKVRLADLTAPREQAPNPAAAKT